jgi:hypothetical protein
MGVIFRDQATLSRSVAVEFGTGHQRRVEVPRSAGPLGKSCDASSRARGDCGARGSPGRQQQEGRDSRAKRSPERKPSGSRSSRWPPLLVLTGRMSWSGCSMAVRLVVAWSLAKTRQGYRGCKVLPTSIARRFDYSGVTAEVCPHPGVCGPDHHLRRGRRAGASGSTVTPRMARTKSSNCCWSLGVTPDGYPRA